MDTDIVKVQVGDVVSVRGTVKRVIDDGGVAVEFLSKTERYVVWATEDSVVGVLVEAADADEPDRGGYVETTSTAGMVLIWRYVNRCAGHVGWLPVGHPNDTPSPWRVIKAGMTSWTPLYRHGEV